MLSGLITVQLFALTSPRLFHRIRYTKEGSWFVTRYITIIAMHRTRLSRARQWHQMRWFLEGTFLCYVVLFCLFELFWKLEQYLLSTYSSCRRFLLVEILVDCRLVLIAGQRLYNRFLHLNNAVKETGSGDLDLSESTSTYANKIQWPIKNK